MGVLGNLDGFEDMEAEIKVEKDEDGSWVAWIPSIPGCISQGKTKREAEKNITKAMNLHLEENFIHG